MTDLAKLLLPAVLTLVCGILLGFLKWAVSRWLQHTEDQPRVDAKLSCTTDVNILQRIGCPCVVVRLIGVSRRETRLIAVEASIEVDREFVAAFEKAFSVPFAQGTSPDLPPPRFRVDLIPSKDSSESVFVVGRDDVVEFLLPVPFVPYEHFLTSPSQKLEVAIRTTDGQRRVVLRGLEVQAMIRSVVEMQGRDMRGPRVPLNMGVTISSKTPAPHLDLVGKANPAPISFPNPGQEA